MAIEDLVIQDNLRGLWGKFKMQKLSLVECANSINQTIQELQANSEYLTRASTGEINKLDKYQNAINKLLANNLD